MGMSYGKQVEMAGKILEHLEAQGMSAEDNKAVLRIAYGMLELQPHVEQVASTLKSQQGGNKH